MNTLTSNLVSILLLSVLLSSCKKADEPQVQDSSPFATNLVGKWEWIKTVIGGKEITPQTVGYSESISYGNDGGLRGNYLRIAQNGSQIQTLYQNDNFGNTNLAEQSLTGQFGSQYIKFILVKSNDNTYQSLITSDLVNDYNQGFGDTQHYYRRVGVPEKP